MWLSSKPTSIPCEIWVACDAPLAVAGRREVENLLAGHDSPLCHGWRAALVGRELQARLAGVGDDGND
jgi:hypothetical protein